MKLQVSKSWFLEALVRLTQSQLLSTSVIRWLDYCPPEVVIGSPMTIGKRTLKCESKNPTSMPKYQFRKHKCSRSSRHPLFGKVKVPQT